MNKQDLAEILADVTGNRVSDILDPGTGAGIYTGAEWAERGEDYGEDALFVLIHDGGPLAPACNLDYEAYDVYNRTAEALKQHGMWKEQATCWYTCVYQDGPQPAEQRRRNQS